MYYPSSFCTILRRGRYGINQILSRLGMNNVIIVTSLLEYPDGVIILICPKSSKIWFCFPSISCCIIGKFRCISVLFCRHKITMCCSCRILTTISSILITILVYLTGNIICSRIIGLSPRHIHSHNQHQEQGYDEP